MNFPSFEGSALSAVTKQVFPFAAKNLTQWGWWQRKAVSTAFDWSSDIFPSDSVTFLRAYQLLGTRNYTKLSTSWHHPTACFWWPPRELPFQSTSSLLTQIRPCLIPATLAGLTLHPIIFHSISKAFLWRGSPLKPGVADYSQPLRASRIAIWTSITQNESISDMCATNPLPKVGQTRSNYWGNVTSLNIL